MYSIDYLLCEKEAKNNEKGSNSKQPKTPVEDEVFEKSYPSSSTKVWLSYVSCFKKYYHEH